MSSYLSVGAVIVSKPVTLKVLLLRDDVVMNKISLGGSRIVLEQHHENHWPWQCWVWGWTQ